jgi:hypothetical protein
MSTEATCRHCGQAFVPTYRAGRFTGRGRLGHQRTHGRSFTAAQFCSDRCRQANYRWRKAQERRQEAQGARTEAFTLPAC